MQRRKRKSKVFGGPGRAPEFAPARSMARRRRIFLRNCSVHVIQRGNNKRPIFDDPRDYEVFLDLIATGVSRSGVALHAYALMTNHFHLLATPADPAALPRFMKWVDGRYVQYFNHRNQRMGTIWNGRYKGLIVKDERYWLTCLRYIEQNPVRAGLSLCPSEYRWSSARAHTTGHSPDWLVSHPLYEALGASVSERHAAYRVLVGEIVHPSHPYLPR